MPLSPRHPEAGPHFARALKVLRTARGLSRRALAEASGVSQTMVKCLERGWRRPRLDHLQRLADALEAERAVFVPQTKKVKPYAPRRMRPHELAHNLERIHTNARYEASEIDRRNKRGQSSSEIGAALGLSASFVNHVLSMQGTHDLGVWLARQADVLLRRLVRRETYAAIAARHGVTLQLVHQIVKAALTKHPDLRAGADIRQLSHLATVLRSARRERGYTLPRLAEASGVSATLIKTLEAGKGKPLVDTLCLLADALGIPARSFIEEKK